jgi:hypothetical protein
MTRNNKNTRSWIITMILLTGIIACVAPVTADSAWLEITSTPSGAWACLDHWDCHYTPITVATDPTSYHSLTVSKDGYQTTTQTVYANRLGSTTPVRIVLIDEPTQTGSLDIDSIPTDSDIWLDERYYGTTPQVVGGLYAGSHSLTLKKAGYYDYLEPFTIVAGEISAKSPRLTAYTSSSGYGDLRIRSNPAGAAVYVNNNYKGTTISSSALYVTQLSPGSYTVRVTLANYQTYTETAVVTAGSVNEIYANMASVVPGPTPNTNGQITVRSNPSGANIYVDNAYMGLTPLTLVNIPAGDHTIILKMNGYQNWQSSVKVPSGVSTDVSGTLASIPTVVPTNSVTQRAPLPTQAPVGLVSIFGAIGICGASAILFRINRKND